jgi:hypothetical protein
MPIDLGSFGESLQRGLGELPAVAVALVLLAGPTLLFIGYRVIGASSRVEVEHAAGAEPFWVCHECRSINELRHDHCYHCAARRDAQEQLELIVEQPSGLPVRVDLPIGVPVMGGRAEATDAIAVGPGRTEHAVAVPVVAEDGKALMLAQTPEETVAEPQP